MTDLNIEFKRTRLTWTLILPLRIYRFQKTYKTEEEGASV